MLGQTVESKMEMFVDTMPTIIQTHLITCKTWEKTTKKAKELEHIIRKCDPPVAALPNLTKGTAAPSLYSHIAHLNDKEETDLHQPFKGVRPKKPKTRGGGKGKQPKQKSKPLPVQVQEDQYPYDDTNNFTTTMRTTEVHQEAVDLVEAKILDDFSEVKMVEVNAVKTHTKANIRVTITQITITKVIMVYITTHVEIINKVIIMANLEAEAMLMAEVITADVVMVGLPSVLWS